jgi:hypothetical protein
MKRLVLPNGGSAMSALLVHAALLGLAVVGLAVVGCGGGAGTVPRGAVEGTVTLGGTPLADGVIRFLPTDGTTGPMVETEIRNGAFSLPKATGPCVGTQRVEIVSFRKTGKKIVNEGVESEEIVQVVPERYNTASELTVMITAGANAPQAVALADGATN